MTAIVEVVAREILDSRGNPTVEADVLVESGAMGRAAVPSGASTGSREAIELRDGDTQRFFGKGVLKAVEHVNTEICEAILGLDVSEQAAHRPRADRARRHREQVAPGRQRDPRGVGRVRQGGGGGVGPVALPLPRRQRARDACRCRMMNVINGGAHANNSLDVQEFMIMPAGLPTFRDALRCGAEIFHTLKKMLDKEGMSTTVGDEGGFAPEPAQQRGGASSGS